MSTFDDLPPELLDTARALDEHRPRMTEPELARVRRRALGADTITLRTRPTGGFMRSRLAITALLAVGALMSSGGAALGVSALSTDTNASSAQYGAPALQAPAAQAPAQRGEVLGGNAQSPPATSGAEDTPSGDVAGERTSGETTPTAAAQAPRQVSASNDDELPFTGFAAIPMLLIGLGLLATGLVLRRNTSRGGAQL